MSKKLYVGNLSYDVTEAQLEEMFSQHGTVETCTVIMDPGTGRSKGFGFVEMASAEDAVNATRELNGKQLDGRTLKVNEARPRESRSGGGGGGGGGGDRGGRGRRW